RLDQEQSRNRTFEVGDVARVGRHQHRHIAQRLAVALEQEPYREAMLGGIVASATPILAEEPPTRPLQLGLQAWLFGKLRRQSGDALGLPLNFVSGHTYGNAWDRIAQGGRRRAELQRQDGSPPRTVRDKPPPIGQNGPPVIALQDPA